MPVLLSLLLAAAAAPASFPFPGQGEAATDYLALDAAAGQVWIPAGNRGQVFVFDVQAHTYKAVGGFPTAKVGKRALGPSAVSVGPEAAYIGNRGDGSVCAVELKSLERGPCAVLPSLPDGVVYVAPTREVWVTTPRTKSLTLLSTEGGKLAVAGTVAIPGSPEGYAVDVAHGLYFTNDEDGDQTFAVDVHTRKIVATYKPGCGKEGPRGLIFDAPSNLLLVGCGDGASVLDLKQKGALVGHLATDAGVDTIDYESAGRRLYLAAGRTGKLVVARVEQSGALTKLSEQPTAAGVRAVVVDARGVAYLPDSRGGRLLVIAPPAEPGRP